MTVNTGKPRQIVYADQVCNDNILINTDYRQGVLVNQRGQLQYTAEWWQPAFDMHKLCGGMAELLPEGVRLTKDTNAEYVMLMTRVEPYKIENGKTYCLSMQIDGEIYNTTFTTPLTQTQWMNTPHVAGSIGYDTDAGVYNVTYTIYTGDVNPVIQAAKLEQGKICTLQLEQPDPAAELLKCQCYLERLGNTFSESLTPWVYVPNGQTYALFPIYYSRKRIIPTIMFNEGAYRLLIANAQTGNIVSGTDNFTITINELPTENMVNISVTFDALGADAYIKLQRLDNKDNAFMLVSAEL